MTALIFAGTRSRDIHHSAHGREDWRGQCSAAEELEFIASVPDAELSPHGGRAGVEGFMRKAAEATCDFYIEHASASDGIPYWDTGALGLARMPDWQERDSNPYDDHEPVDSSAAAIAAQGLLHLGRYLKNDRYWHAGLTVCRTIFSEPYLSTSADHQGLLLHAVHHRPNGWDTIPQGRKVPAGEACMWR